MGFWRSSLAERTFARWHAWKRRKSSSDVWPPQQQQPNPESAHVKKMPPCTDSTFDGQQSAEALPSHATQARPEVRVIALQQVAATQQATEPQPHMELDGSITLPYVAEALGNRLSDECELKQPSPAPATTTPAPPIVARPPPLTLTSVGDALHHGRRRRLAALRERYLVPQIPRCIGNEQLSSRTFDADDPHTWRPLAKGMLRGTTSSGALPKPGATLKRSRTSTALKQSKSSATLGARVVEARREVEARPKVSGTGGMQRTPSAAGLHRVVSNALLRRRTKSEQKEASADQPGALAPSDTHARDVARSWLQLNVDVCAMRDGLSGVKMDRSSVASGVYAKQQIKARERLARHKDRVDRRSSRRHIVSPTQQPPSETTETTGLKPPATPESSAGTGLVQHSASPARSRERDSPITIQHMEVG